MSPRFFIDRPILATVLSLLITIAGAISYTTLPISQYPQVTPPTIQVDCNYPGANAQVVADTVAAPIEQQVNGVEDMLYMSSQCTSDGTYTLTVTFKIGTDLNMSQIRVLNRVALAYPQLPDVVNATGVTTRKRSSEILMTLALSSPKRRYDQLYLSNYAVIRLREELSRIPGVSDVLVFGQRDYSMRIWVDPEQLSTRSLTANDVVLAVQQQNAPLVAGQVGITQTPDGQAFQFPVTGTGRLTTVEDFEQIVVKVGSSGQLVKVKDVARVEMNAKSEDVSNTFDNKPTVGLAVFLLADANALEARDRIVEKMNEMSESFPEDIKYEIGYDTTPFIRESVREVFKSLWESIALVALVVLVFLQSWRAAIIPLAAVPVAIVGTFAAMVAATALGQALHMPGLQFSVNNLTLFGLVLAVGIVVDDAIVVVEAVQHHMETGLNPREATIRAMDDVAGPVVAVGVVLAMVFIPCAFLSGIVGQFFRQFALTIAVSTAISTFNSLTLSPALCAIFLKPPHARPDVPTRILNFSLGWFFGLFDRTFGAVGRVYVRGVRVILRVPVLVLAGYAVLVGLGVALYPNLPSGFIPQQDKGYLIASIQLPDASAAERTRQVIDTLSKSILEYEVEEPAAEGDPEAVLDKRDGTRWVRYVRPVKHVNSVAGNSFVLSAYGSNFGSMFIILEGFDKRRTNDLYADTVRTELTRLVTAKIPEAQVNIFGAPAVSGLGRAGGFRIMIEDKGNLGPHALQQQTDNFVAKSRTLPQVTGLFTVFKMNSPQVFADIDRQACFSRGVVLNDVNTVQQASMGSRYVNDFNRFGRTWQVNVQGDRRFRDEIEDIGRLKVRNNQGGMVPLGAVLRTKLTASPLVITRYNTYPAAAVNGNVTAGMSSGDARAALEELGRTELPTSMTAEWTELSYIEQLAGRSELGIPGVFTFRGDTTVLIFGLSVAFVFLVLAALYESFAFPFAVLLVVPVCVVFSLGAIWLTDPGSAVESAFRLGLLPADGESFAKGTWQLGVAEWIDHTALKNVGRFIAWAGIRKQDVNIFTQVGFVVLIGLACKNAILIVEFARTSRLSGMDRQSAVLAACKLRFRPILMTSVAFILGVLPLVMATGAGSEMRQALGIAVLGGMAGVTVFGIFLTPVFFSLVDQLTTSSLFANRWVRRVSDGVLMALSMRFVRPVAQQMFSAAVTRIRRRPTGT